MNRILREIAYNCGILLLGVLAGLVLITAVYALPTERMRANAQSAAALLTQEGAYPLLYGGSSLRMDPGNYTDPKVFLLNSRGTARDNVTDALMLNTACYQDEGTLLERAMRSAHAAYDGISFEIAAFSGCMAGDEGSISDGYARYWHGYLVVLKPLLLLLDYTQIKLLNVLCMVTLLAAVIVAMWKRGRRTDLELWLYTLLFTVPVVIPFCMQYCTVTYTMLAAMLIAVCRIRDLSSLRVGRFFLLIGMVTAYVDFLTFPLMALGLPLVYLLNGSMDMSLPEKLKKVVSCGLSWAFGYVGMWGSKWVLASLILGENIIGDAIGQVLYRSSSVPDAGGASISSIRALASNLSCFTNVYFLLLIAGGIVIVWILRRRTRSGWSWQDCIPYLCICVVPFLWAVIFRNHSYGHGSFTYRMFTMAIYGGMSMLVSGEKTGGKTYA